MLDQNTDRMWYVIGAIVIGAAIIAMGLNIFNESFDSVDSMMSNLTGIASDNVSSIGNDGIYTEEEIDNLINNEGYIPVATADELNNIRKSGAQTFGAGSRWEESYSSGMDGKYIQVGSINLSSISNFEPIGVGGSRFTGVYDGGGYDIIGLKINKPDRDYVGMFGYTFGAEFLNISMVNSRVIGHQGVGSVVGRMASGKMSNSTSSGRIKGSWWTGSLVGYNDGSQIINSSSSGFVEGDTRIGGLVGTNYVGSSIVQSYSTATVKGRTRVGGLVGHSPQSTISNSYASGSVTGNSQIGGLVGVLYSHGSVDRSYSTSSINYGGGGLVGGLVGELVEGSSISRSYYDKNVSKQSDSRGVGLSTDDMLKLTSYDVWDFDNIWQMQEGQYPTLR